jgi:fimbrial chaperone protein
MRPLNFTVRPHFSGVITVSPLQLAFHQSRAQRNIDLVLPTLKATTLYVVVGSEPKDDQKPEWFLTESPTKGRFCVTASEIEAALGRVPWPKIRVSGAQLLEALPVGIEILIVYSDGGDYVTREHLAWYRQVK